MGGAVRARDRHLCASAVFDGAVGGVRWCTGVRVRGQARAGACGVLPARHVRWTVAVAGPWQFARGLRIRHPKVHRIVGWTSTVSIVIASAAALVLSTVNTAGAVGFFGFAALAVLWCITTLRAVRAARTGDFRGHQA
ncbi:DUF2306 domain-containing protein [Actinoallomurus sp. NBC_01490]|uniref:DUF2306 domain-containing protein n=1 Tax=Actinoallomurus sp. NBC_01490 TaxID=2903557 RepID=UPI002E321DD5|nr:DUF2306 domain-containing protein [Actinoallomurus sp. NBC_01490]